MNSNMIGLINMREDHPLQEINDTRPLSTLPIGGLIDFTLSNMVNAASKTSASCSPVSPGRSWTTSGPARNGVWPTRATACSICRKNGRTSNIP